MPRSAMPATSHNRIVIKVGSAVLSGDHGEENLASIAQEIGDLRAEGREVVLVSSGAVAAGLLSMSKKERPKTIPEKQALAALGQPALMQRWEKEFSKNSTRVAQILLTAEDLGHRHRYLNARRTVETLLKWSILPIINENDTVMVDEIKFGDNDQLSALISTLVSADLLVILSDIDSLFDADPRKNPEAKPIPFVPKVDASIYAMAGETPNGVGTGGMKSKLLAAEKAQAAGIPTLLLAGNKSRMISDALEGKPVGTLFSGGAKRFSGQKLWLYQLPKPSGELTLDEGAAKVLKEKGASLLPAGIRGVKGVFGVGDAVKCLSPNGEHIGTGLVNYSKADVERIKGVKSSQIEGILGFNNSDEVIHRDYFVLAGEIGEKS